MRRLVGVAFVCLLTMLGNISNSQQEEQQRMIVTADNPNPQSLPTLAVWQDDKLSPGRKLTMVSATFPNVPGFTCDSWCYESDVDFVDARALPGGKLQLRHRWKKHPEILLVTVVTPEPGAVEFSAHLEHAEGGDEMPAELPFVNLCWQVRRSPSFASAPDPYPKFVERCFIFTARGRTFLHETTRRKIPVRPADDLYNNPPWVQMYAAGWLPLPQAAPDSWADYSPDQYVTPVIGVISRDGKYLAALANDSATVMAQAWHDCLHNNPQWLPADVPPAKRRWRLKVYAMENDPKALLERVRRDFSNALRDAPESGNRTKGSSMYLEFEGERWTFSAKGPYAGRLDRRNLFVIQHPWVQAATDNFGQIETTVTIPDSGSHPSLFTFTPPTITWLTPIACRQMTGLGWNAIRDTGSSRY